MTELKTKAMLQQISDVAWLVHQGEHRLGILNKDIQQNFTYITGKEFVSFTDETEVLHHFGNVNLFDEQITTPAQVQDTYYIRGYEVDYPQPIALEEDNPDYSAQLPLYTKIAGSTVYYAAGYYCVNFEKGWKHAHGPKLATLEKYGFEGPFKTEIEMRIRLKDLNKKKKDAKP